MINIIQPGIPFWGGPAHGDYRTIQSGQPVVYLPSFHKVDYIYLTDPDATSFPLAYDIIRYNRFKFMWHWKGDLRVGTAMVCADNSVLEIEYLLDFLGGLWGD